MRSWRQWIVLDSGDWSVYLAVGFLLGNMGLLAYLSWVMSPTVDEVAHLPAGLSHWELGHFDLYRVNPPLVRMVAALPVLATQPVVDWSKYNPGPRARSEFAVGQAFLHANRERVQWLFALGRWACIPFWVLGAVACGLWGQALWGARAGLLALLLWCLCPNLLGHGALLTPDVAGAALAVATLYAGWCWRQQPSGQQAVLVGLLLGLAQLAKTTNLLLVGLWPVYWLLGRERAQTSSRLQKMGQLLLPLAVAWLVLNLGYGFEKFGKRLDSYYFMSRLFGGESGNRFTGTWLGALPVPLPADYVQGIDEQRMDFEEGLLSYLHGEYRHVGWWYYYLYALGVKLPLGTLGIMAIALTLFLACRQKRHSWREEMLWLLPGLGYLLLVSSQTGFNHHLRYVFPALPFFFVGASRLWGTAWWEVKGIRWMVGMLLLATVVSSLRIYPHSLSYFNELAGGPLGGPRHLLDSNIDWGQDLYYLHSWAEAHPEARPLYVAYFGSYAPQELYAEMHPIEILAGPQPGWYAVSVNYLYGYGVRRSRQQSKDYAYFQELEPVAYAGYSIYIYHLDLAEANRLRRQLGLPPLPEQVEQQQRIMRDKE